MPLKQRLLISLYLMLLATAIISVLSYYSLKTGATDNNFNRNYSFEKAALINAAAMPASVRSIAGMSSSNIYLETDSVNKLYFVDSTMKSLKAVMIPVVNNDSIQSLFKVIVDSPFVTIAAGNVPAVMESRLYGSTLLFHRFPTHTFTRIAVIGHNSYLLRMFDKNGTKWDQIFVQGNTITGHVNKEIKLSQQSGDAGFASDGLLHYDAFSGLVLYNYFYEDKLLCFDTLLRLKYKANTIDRITTGGTKSGALFKGDNKMITNINPTKDLHYQSCTNNGRIFINSRVKADNETAAAFRSNAVIDVYDIITGKYLSSFYIPFYKGKYLRDFRVKDKIIFVLYDGFLARYRLPML
ncbi:hypothetical protein FRZ67_19100 [Panacibacter ginsenosidivorans]|uniref:Uncharacterized protein n=1 Tax=Panacibacter ginsenosidivorans TaxID=1813871 RepID=A0A5B8VE85_9BACT|nr:hypothetical protein [Panacibacter ginsenosidivorans]QEC69311.1 hypothetical protein FRZ67_19100 [Panacibacter ginsenosidivorans]